MNTATKTRKLRALVRFISHMSVVATALLPVLAQAGRGSDGSESHSHVRALFDANNPSIGPFPTNLLTVEDATQNTGRRINLPLPDCSEQVSECEDLAVLNTLDGFGLQTRLSIPFDGAIDPNSVSSDSVFVVDLGGTLPSDPPATGARVGINQAVWDTQTNALHVEVDQQLDQHRRYGVIVTNVLADDGSHLKTNSDFAEFLIVGEPAWYRDELKAAVSAARHLGVKNSDIAVASVFTTQTATSILERIRDEVKGAPAPAPANFEIGPGGTRAVYDVSRIATITWRQNQLLASPTTLVDTPIDVNLLKAVVPNAVGTTAFSRLTSIGACRASMDQQRQQLVLPPRDGRDSRDVVRRARAARPDLEVRGRRCGRSPSPRRECARGCDVAAVVVNALATAMSSCLTPEMTSGSTAALSSSRYFAGSPTMRNSAKSLFAWDEPSSARTFVTITP